MQKAHVCINANDNLYTEEYSSSEENSVHSNQWNKNGNSAFLKHHHSNSYCDTDPPLIIPQSKSKCVKWLVLNIHITQTVNVLYFCNIQFQREY